MMPFDPSELLNTRNTLKKTKANDVAAALSDVIGSAGSHASDATAASVEEKAQSNSSYASVVKSSGTAMADGGVKAAKAKYVGLINQGATCYLNSTLQTLFMTPEFREAVFRWNFVKELHLDKDESEADCIPLQLQRLFGKLVLSTSNAISTIDLTKSFGSDFGVYQQQDIQELLRILMDRLEEVMKTQAKSEGSSSSSASSSTADGGGSGEGASSSDENGAFIANLFGGSTANYIRCLDESKYESERLEPFLDLSLHVSEREDDKPKSLIECVKHYLKPELLSGDNQYYIESLKKKVDAIKGMRIIKLPKILTIHLKRFMYHVDAQGNYSQKKFNNVVKFPMTMDLNRYVSRRNSSSAKSEAEAVVEEDEFESFLAEEMDLLLSKEPEVEEKEAVPVPGPAEDHNHRESAAGGVGSDSNNNGNSSSNSNSNSKLNGEEELEDNEFSNMPDLVDEQKNKHPEQLEEEEAYNLKISKFPNMKYLSRAANNEELAELIETRGEWIYELYAVIIHSGNVNGGHYYAYIKDVDSGDWSEFNDSRVSTMTEKDVTQAWGSQISSASEKTRKYRDSNGYLLWYRKVNLKLREAEVTLESTKELVPEYIKTEMEIEAEKRRQEEIVKNEAKASKKITIKFKSTLLTMNQFKTYSTLHDMMTHAWFELKLFNEPEFSDDLSRWRVLNDDDSSSDGSSMGPIWDRIRLMDWTYVKGTTHDLISADKTCIDLLENRTFFVELRSADAAFDVYDMASIRCTIKLWDSASASVKDYEYNVAIPTSNFTEGEFIRKIHDYLALKREVDFSLEEISICVCASKLEVFSVDFRSEKLNNEFLFDRGIKDTFNVLVERISEDMPGLKHITYLNNQVSIRILPSDATTIEGFKADKMWTIARLKEEIASYVKLHPIKLISKQLYDYIDLKPEEILLQFPYNSDLKDDSATVFAAVIDKDNYYNNSYAKLIYLKRIRNTNAPKGMKPMMVSILKRHEVFKDSFIHVITDITETGASSLSTIDESKESDKISDESAQIATNSTNSSHKQANNECDKLVEIELNEYSSSSKDTEVKDLDSSTPPAIAVAVAELIVAVDGVDVDVDIDGDGGKVNEVAVAELVLPTVQLQVETSHVSLEAPNHDSISSSENSSPTHNTSSINESSTTSAAGVVGDPLSDSLDTPTGIVEPTDFATKSLQEFGISEKYLDTIDQSEVEIPVCYPETWATQPTQLQSQTFNQIRTQIFDLLVSKNKISPELSPQHIRCWGSYVAAINNPRLIVDDVTLGKAAINHTHLDHILVEILPSEVVPLDKMLPPPEYSKFNYATVMRFCRKTWSIVDCIQLGYSLKLPVVKIQTYLADHFNIDVDNARFTKLWYGDFSKTFIYEFRNKDWIGISKEASTTSYLAYSDIVVISDSGDDYGDLTPGDLESIKIQEAAKDSYIKKNEWWLKDKKSASSSSSSSSSSSATSSSTSAATATVAPKKLGGGGVSIKRKGDNKSKPAATASASSVSSSAAGPANEAYSSMISSSAGGGQGCQMMFGDYAEDDNNINYDSLNSLDMLD